MTSSLPLDDYVVVDLSSGIAGGYCTKLLADAGARVVKVEDPGGDPLRRWSASGAPVDTDRGGALFSFLSGSKESIVADAEDPATARQVAELLDAADAVVWSSGSDLAALPSLAPSAIHRSHPHLTVTSLSPFGLDGPWAGRPATEFTLQAWSGGVIGIGRGRPERPPVFVGGRVGEWLSGVYAAIGTLAARARTASSGTGELVDVSMLEVAALCLTYYPVSFFDIAGRPYRPHRSIPSPAVETAKDGFVGVGTGTGQQWLDFCAMVGHPEWGEDDSLRADRKRIAPAVREWMARHSVEEILDMARAFRIPCAPIANGASVTSIDQYRARGVFVDNPRDGFTQPGPPYRFSAPLLRPPGPAPRLGEHTGVPRREPRVPSTAAVTGAADEQLPFAGLRVLDMTAFWAGPLCTHILAMLGADVIHVESPSRPDGTRLLSGLPFTDDRWWERSGIFAGLNTSKLGLTLDLRDERGRQALRELIATCDVVVENYTPRVLEQIGLDYDAVKAVRDDIVMLRMPGFGLDGPWRDLSAFGFVIEDASGHTWMTGYPDENPLEPYCVGDPNAGLHALVALLLALEQRRRTGQGALVEAAMTDAAINIAAEQVVEFSAYGALLERNGNRGPTAAPQNLYPTADSATDGEQMWVAISVETDHEWAALVDVLGRPAWALDGALATGEGRRSRQDEVDAHLSGWCGMRTGDEIVDTLWNAGIPVAKVMQPHQQPELPQLRHRGFFRTVDHPVTGTARHSTLPMRFSRNPDGFPLRPAPLLGEHTRAILAGIGLDASAVDALDEEGVIGTTPVATTPSARGSSRAS